MFTGLWFQTEKTLKFLLFISRYHENLFHTVSGDSNCKKRNSNSASYFKMCGNLVGTVTGRYFDGYFKLS